MKPNQVSEKGDFVFSLSSISLQMLDTFNVNVVAPLMVTKALLPLLNRAVEWRKTVKGKDGEVKKPLVVNMSSILGSIENNTGIGELRETAA